ncbi:Beta-3 adrenergic receptor [Holothuria leucospilota]|uniref:Beta-3 adrenergic receptor n=1 Tax=Holothuria leucospilota TaxID=206669 RepID=A0A9Q1CA64_HOLLE|nr:Beta-3 adrenergic receptor [Holothuria leucospilota]
MASINSQGRFYIEGTIDVTLSVFAIICNGTLILAVALSSCLQTYANVFMVNLAVTDFLLAIVAAAHSVSFLVPSTLPGLNTLCAIDVAFAQICVGCSIYTLASVSVTRYIIITKSTETYKLIFQRRFIALWIVLIWVVSASATLLPLPFGIGKLGYHVHCDVIHGNNTQSDIYERILAVAYLPIPLVILIVCYTKIYLYIRRHNQQLRRRLDVQLGNGDDIGQDSHGL